MKIYSKKTVKIVFSTALAIIFTGALLLLFLLRPFAYTDEIKNASEEFAIPPSLIRAIILAESGFDGKATSDKGAVGLMQLLPSTAAFIAEQIGQSKVDLYLPETNIRLGTAYVKYLIGRFGSVKTAMAAYNAGEGRVREWLKDKKYSSDGINLSSIPYPETDAYVKKVFRLRAIYGVFDK